MAYKVSTRQLTETVKPVIEPVGLHEMKVHCEVEDSADFDTFLAAAIEAARQFVEKEYQLSLVQRTYRADISHFSDVIYLPLPPLSSVTNIKYYTNASPMVLSTVASTVYRVNTSHNYVYRDYGQSWPVIGPRHDAVQITFVAGQEPSTDSPQDLAGNVPAAIKAAIKLHAADLFHDRSRHSTMKMQKLSTCEMLLAPWREY